MNSIRQEEVSEEEHAVKNVHGVPHRTALVHLDNNPRGNSQPVGNRLIDKSPSPVHRLFGGAAPSGTPSGVELQLPTTVTTQYSIPTLAVPPSTPSFPPSHTPDCWVLHPSPYLKFCFGEKKNPKAQVYKETCVKMVSAVLFELPKLQDKSNTHQ